ncbi:hypothetical protein GUITHDRAFT_106786 [Guillardia theta CCMP2712]|uniref:Mis18 domain-containing protein n=1 Tax=Guillardia theta (strain CCMP2712) TaxID=905079 RepID=L1JFQ0_GUITC|nr:hypothetical protein GUITHDRAFT_106786 [Guillardia theta CCMP2712]EKX47338.1 hypothetical protein GUITHDRAFT_106786 [Guillardia theta CCMP2712]|eukprot:XP_005834318.1 hypothetical protein GUITHDRAFT_106786 [Guillardia theta CCMP2712]
MRGSGMAVQEDVRGPLVFQCRECLTIIGDSFSMVSAVESLDAIILSVAVQCTTGRRTSDGHGSIYQEVRCTCGNLIGRCFFKHPHSEQYDIFYELGSGNDNPLVPPLGDVTTSNNSNQAIERILETIQADIAKVLECHLDLCAGIVRPYNQMKAMTLLFDERLSSVEAVCKPVGSKGSSKQGEDTEVQENPKKRRR